MGVRTWRHLLIAVFACGLCLSPAGADGGQGRRSQAGPPTWAGGPLQHAKAPQRGRRMAREDRVVETRAARVAAEPYATGYERGLERGRTDGREGDRYDPVRHRDYRDADDGYSSEYGSRDAYKNNYRAGFRQGYEEGYRQGAKNRR